MRSISKWDGFLKEISHLLFFWFFGVIFFFIYRCSFIFIYRKALGDSLPFEEFLKAFYMGFKFDCTGVSYFMLIPFACALILSWFGKFDWIKRVRIVCQYLFVILSGLICIITINYYKEFNDQFNNFVFLGLYDDQEAILKTIIDSYNPLLNTLIWIVVSVVGILIFRYFEPKALLYTILRKIQPKMARVAFVILLLYLFMACIRGTLTHPPVMRKWASLSTDAFLNKTIINPYRSLKYAYQDYKSLNSITGENPFVKDIQELYTEDKVSQIIKKEAPGASIEKPKQIFVVIMESYDAWPLMDKYAPFGLSTRLRRIAEEGIHFTNFLPSYSATFYAYGTITGGIPYCGVNISQLGAMDETYITSIFNQFEDLGYKTNMFYGGFLSWENIGEFTSHMGCDKIYSGADAGGKSQSGAWGIDDEDLFDMVIEKVNPEEYTFNLILTSSYHGPYSVDVESRGFIYQSTDEFPEEMKQYFDGRMKLKEMGHLWYGDWAIGRFVDEANTKYDQSLFAFTGDHFGRRFINHSPNLYESSAVPFILYGAGISGGRNQTPGSHVDIAPTLIELIAPENFVYHSFGQSMFAEDKNYGIGFEKAIDTDSLYFTPKDAQVEEINLKDFREGKSEQFKYANDYQKLMALSWHYIIYGDSLQAKEAKSLIKR